jgi:hypothetical protein
MINKNKYIIKRYCSEPLELIENYNAAISDTEHIWDLHHRNEITPCGVKSINELKSLNLYWHRPASELVFLRRDEHRTLHSRNRSRETKEKISNTMIGMKFSQEHRDKLSEKRLGKKHSEETKRKMAESHRRYWEEWRKNRC